jgi:hypothetical protein
MANISIRSFGGISPKTPPRGLQPSQAQAAVNSGVFTGTLKPMKGLGTSVATVVGSAQTIYKFGQDSTDETAGWLSWNSDVDVARSQINGDTEEWTFYTGDGAPKAIRAGFTSSPIPLGLAFPTAALTATLGAEPEDAATLVQETRAYTYTYVYKIGARAIESAPAPSSTSVDVYPNQTVTLTNFLTPPTGYVATHVRVYRTSAGAFLYVTEIALSTAVGSGFADNVDPENLAEELPSLYWLPPPDTLKGLTNLPNGVMAGFNSRDVYFCEPYVPHAWPDAYRQTLDYPVVGLGRMDTTLAVLTKGTPYFIQGSHPDSMVVIKSDLEQACVSKGSIVSLNNSVFYCSPDGLIALTPGGSRNITEAMFTYNQWQTQINPESVDAYHQDMKYIGFYDNGVTAGSFVYDLSTNQFSLNDLTADAGYQSLRNDKLYLLKDGAIKPWEEGADLTYTWKSKVFAFPIELSMSCMRVEAESYPITAKIYAGGSLIHTQTVANRNPFRLPVKATRDWEVQLEGTSEVFAVAMAQGIGELSDA